MEQLNTISLEEKIDTIATTLKITGETAVEWALYFYFSVENRRPKNAEDLEEIIPQAITRYYQEMKAPDKNLKFLIPLVTDL
jgi:hypothetical protein